MKAKSVRSCLGCGLRRPKKELVRIVKSPDGKVKFDLTGREPGRGGYFCPRVECFRQVRKRLCRALRCQEDDLNWPQLEIDFGQVIKGGPRG